MIWDAEDRPPKPETATRRLGLLHDVVPNQVSVMSALLPIA